MSDPKPAFVVSFVNKIEIMKKLEIVVGSIEIEEKAEESVENLPTGNVVFSSPMSKEEDFKTMVKQESEQRERLESMVAKDIEEYKKCLEKQEMKKSLGIVDDKFEKEIETWENGFKKQHVAMNAIMDSFAVQRRKFVTTYKITGTIRNTLLHGNITTLLQVAQCLEETPFALESNPSDQELCDGKNVVVAKEENISDE